MKLNKAMLSTNFFAGDVVGGIGPYLAIYLLTGLQWSPGNIGMVLAIGSLTTVALQTPAGAFIDSTRKKRLLLASCALLIGFATISILLFSQYPAVIYIAQIFMGIAVAFVGPCIAAITLGISGPDHFTVQMGANQAANHSGNVFAAILGAGLALWISAEGVFWLVALMAVGMAISIGMVSGSAINHNAARGGLHHTPNDGDEPSTVSTILADKRLLTLVLCVFMFHFANAAMLPLVGQKLSVNSNVNIGVAFAATCIVVAQFWMTIMSIICAARADIWGRKPLFLLAFFILPIRGMLFMWLEDPVALISVQSLDGIANGIFGVIILLIAADLTRGTGRFNLVQGALAAVVGIGSAASNLLAEEIVQFFGYSPAFITLAVLAFIGGTMYLFLMPETLPAQTDEDDGTAPQQTS
ncbi:Major Facilitator Superfamily protein [Pseudovibrio sp. W64]|uniref:MFS transporter n=1 Tax=unclassified Pseudovibrio TaxID=2627060 RepID=UPI0007AE4FAE|nr:MULTISPECIES: MFS transporter [unclassified Pseudovibrio]KZK79713.1 Major Facilitator Superfamily protein [Pseudovibrio sp. Ad13]KZK81050.1 Major Facilitator Superfamily protein [Pseudovibrio sp. W64]KZK94609.1 Major Facilitator Superfamily protein [Pseudovibrio sp. W74]KZL04506.1 Major Facilitator Superfamily protein [Pseudovibrio sp. Ad14]KZL13681.1 Major Facilitator Superfamily protein [Pseudovibrio sp. Ad37]